MAKEFFSEHKLPFTDYNVATDLEKRQEMIAKSGQMGVPVILIGSDLVVGFTKEKISQLLGVK